MFKKHTLPYPFSFHRSLFSTKEFPWFVNKILVELMEVIYQNICLQNWENIANRYKTGCHASINIAVPSWIKIFTPRGNNLHFHNEPEHFHAASSVPPINWIISQAPSEGLDFPHHIIVNSFYEVVNLVWYSNLLKSYLDNSRYLSLVKYINI